MEVSPMFSEGCRPFPLARFSYIKVKDTLGILEGLLSDYRGCVSYRSQYLNQKYLGGGVILAHSVKGYSPCG